MLVIATVAAMIWANSFWQQSYFDFWQTSISIEIGTFQLSKPLLLWVNDGLMAVFFFLVGLEIKRELLVGELSSVKQAAMPIAAAMGGMVVPAGLFLLLVNTPNQADGWGIPMATDIAFALGIMKLLGNRVPLALKVFLTALAIIDDIGAVLVIAIFYSSDLALFPFVWVGIGLVFLLLLNLLRFRWPIFYLVAGIIMWYGMLKGGIHPTLAGVLAAFCIPTNPKFRLGHFLEKVDHILNKIREQRIPQKRAILPKEQLYGLEDLATNTDRALPPLQKLENRLHGPVMFLIMPIFALANAGVVIPADVIGVFASPVTYAIIAGLVVGKVIGITGFSWLAKRVGLGDLPKGTRWMQIIGLGFLGGVGFTMSLFIANLGYTQEALIAEAKIGILGGSLVSGVLGAFFLYRFSQPPEAD